MIENGLLIEFPSKCGDYVYGYGYGLSHIVYGILDEITIDASGIRYTICENADLRSPTYWVSFIYKEKGKAESCLEKLRNR